jgi:Helix-turn-helix domain
LNACVNSAWKAKCDEPSDKLVLIYLADRANPTGKAWPHLPTIVRQTELGRRTVIEAIKRLEVRGHLTVTRAVGCSNSYIVHPVTDALTSAATAPVQQPHVTSAATAPLPVPPPHQHPNPHGTPKGTGKPAPKLKLEWWQLDRDEKSLTERIRKELGKDNPDKKLVESLKSKREKVRAEMKGQPLP